MNPLAYLNTILGTGLVIILVYIDYIKKHNTDKFRRLLFLAVLGTVFLAILMQYAGIILVYFDFTGINELNVLDSVQLFTKTAGFYIAFVFADYCYHNSTPRSAITIKTVSVFLILYGISLIINHRLGFYFLTGKDNILIPGRLFVINQIIGYLPVLLCIAGLIPAFAGSKRINVLHTLIFCLFAGLGGIGDLALNTSGFLWLCFITAVLGIYFNIVREDAKTDALTGIGNRYSFNEFIETLSRRNRKGKVFRESWAVVMIDMNHFKEINDTYGHLEGDNALKDMAKIIKGCIRHSDFAARYGGDEFVLAARAESDIEQLMARIRRDLDIFNETAGRPYRLEISYGCDIFTTGRGRTVAEFLNHVDNLMYKHKARQRRISDRINLKNERMELNENEPT